MGIYLLWRGLGPIFSFLASKLWEEFGRKGIKLQFWPNFDHIFGPNSGTLGPIKKNWSIYLLWRGLGPIFSFLALKLWVEFGHKGIKLQFWPNLDHIFGPNSGNLAPIQKKINLVNLPIMAGFRSNFELPNIKTVGAVRPQRNKIVILAQFLPHFWP